MTAAVTSPASAAEASVKTLVDMMPVKVASFGALSVGTAAVWLPLVLAVTVQLASLGLVFYKWRLEVEKNTPANAPPRNYTRLILGAVAAIALACIAFFTFRSSRASAATLEGPDGDVLDTAGAMPGVGAAALPPYYLDTADDMGVRETLSNGKPNPLVQRMFEAVDGFAKKLPDGTLDTSHINPAKVHWCAVYINWLLKKAKQPRTRSAMALSFRNWGTEVAADDALPGDVVVFKRRTGGKWDGVSGHVGLFNKWVGAARVSVRGGNQSDRVCDSTFPVVDIVAIRRAPVRAVPAKPPVDRGRVAAAGGAAGTGVAGGVVATGALDEPATTNIPEVIDTVKRVGETAQDPLFNLGTPSAVKIAVCIGIACTALTLVGLWYSHRNAKPVPAPQDGDHA